MKQLVLALYAEGTTDYLFLPPVIQRTVIQVLRQHEQQQINVSHHVLFVCITSQLDAMNVSYKPLPKPLTAISLLSMRTQIILPVIRLTPNDFNLDKDSCKRKTKVYAVI